MPRNSAKDVQRSSRDTALIPAAVTAEKHVLSSVLNGAVSFEEISEKLTLASFTDKRHRAIWQAMAEAYKGPFAEFIDSSVVLAQVKDPVALGGENYLFALELHFVTTFPDYYVKQVKDAEKRRKIFDVAQEIKESAGAPGHAELLLQAQTKLESLEQEEEQLPQLKQLLRDALIYVESCYHGNITQYSLGVDSLDKKIIVRAPDLVVVAGRPGSGKTAFGIQLAETNAEDLEVGFVSAEMTAQELILRLLSRKTGISTDRLLRKHGLNPEEDPAKLMHALEQLQKLKLHIDDTSGITINQVEARARAWVKQGVQLIVVDYLQKIKGDPSIVYNSREQEVADIVTRLKELGKKLNIAVVCLAQIGREVERRRSKNNPFPRPSMADLRESGAIEQEANVILFLHREELEEVESFEILLRKQRQGESPLDFPVVYDKRKQTFRNQEW